MFKNLTIKGKLFLATTVSVFGLVFLLVLFYFTSINTQSLKTGKIYIETLKVDMLTLRRNEKDFILRKDYKYAKKFTKDVGVLHRDANLLIQNLKRNGIDNAKVKSFNKIIDSYKKDFTTFVKKQEAIGLDEKSGLYGSLRNSVQKVQNSAKESLNNELLAMVYDLRKEEKDFMLRRNLKYVEKFNQKHASLLQKSYLSENQILNLKNYKEDFLALIEAEKVVGLTSKEGLQGKMRATIHKSEVLLKSLVSELTTEVDTKINKSLMNMAVVGIILMLIISFISYFIGTNLIHSVLNFRDSLFSFFKYLNRETDEIKPLNIIGKDEIAQMSIVVNEHINQIESSVKEDKKLIDNAIAILKEYEQGDFSPKISLKSSNPSLNELSSIINNMSINLERNILDILSVMKDYTESNYRTTISLAGKKGHLEKLSLSINTLGESISSLLKKSLEIGLTLDNASDILIKNVAILNDSSNSAAASLEQTAAALEEVTSTVVSNSGNIKEMSLYAEDLNKSVKIGQKQASDTTTSMENITEQVTLINEAISIIDQIAFQTNILSLNAAVEAATAGEAGKGFAVVAAEVRNLASRSAEAAKEIKDLVENATTKANEGKEISAKMINGYSLLLENIDKTTKKIDEISVSSTEQQNGITQINDAVNSLDQQTQQNASIASKTNEIAIRTDELSKEIVSDSQSKEFIGKENISIKEEN